MAYGDENTKLENFDRIIPENVFQEVTSITTDQFRFLRDGGDYVDEETGGPSISTDTCSTRSCSTTP